jgi:hypothetical protein
MDFRIYNFYYSLYIIFFLTTVLIYYYIYIILKTSYFLVVLNFKCNIYCLFTLLLLTINTMIPSRLVHSIVAMYLLIIKSFIYFRIFELFILILLLLLIANTLLPHYIYINFFLYITYNTSIF